MVTLMSRLDELLATVEGYRDAMIEEMTTMLRIPAMGPENGGEGEPHPCHGA